MVLINYTYKDKYNYIYYIIYIHKLCNTYNYIYSIFFNESQYILYRVQSYFIFNFLKFKNNPCV